MEHIVILGNGVAGITAARHIRKRSSVRITVVSGESEYFFSRTALMYIFMGHMKFEHTKPYEDWFWKKNEINLKFGWVQRVDFENHILHFESGDELNYDQLILATGSSSNTFDWPGENLKGVQGLYSLQDLELMESNTADIRKAVIIGGGLIGIEMAEMLHSRSIGITYLIREKHFWDNVLPVEEAKMIDQHLRKRHIDLRNETELEEILNDGKGGVRGIRTKSGELIDCQFVGLAVGVHPNLGLFTKTTLECDRGILVNEFLETNISNVYAIGDCAQLRNPPGHRKAIEAVWYAGRMMGETVAATITGNHTPYRPGIWFNSAKFFDIEYQTYGNVPPKCPVDCKSFYWAHQDGTKSIRINFESSSRKVLGINLMGIRHRHEVWNQWITDENTVEKVISQLDRANFDPELFRKSESVILEKFNLEFPDNPAIARKDSILQKLFGY